MNRFSHCPGSYKLAIQPWPVAGARIVPYACPDCGRLFKRSELAGGEKRNVPLHSPDQRAEAGR